jgi:hypothetical protein
MDIAMLFLVAVFFLGVGVGWAARGNVCEPHKLGKINIIINKIMNK